MCEGHAETRAAKQRPPPAPAAEAPRAPRLQRAAAPPTAGIAVVPQLALAKATHRAFFFRRRKFRFRQRTGAHGSWKGAFLVQQRRRGDDWG